MSRGWNGSPGDTGRSVRRRQQRLEHRPRFISQFMTTHHAQTNDTATLPTRLRCCCPVPSTASTARDVGNFRQPGRSRRGGGARSRSRRCQRPRRPRAAGAPLISGLNLAATRVGGSRSGCGRLGGPHKWISRQGTSNPSSGSIHARHPGVGTGLSSTASSSGPSPVNASLRPVAGCSGHRGRASAVPRGHDSAATSGRSSPVPARIQRASRSRLGASAYAELGTERPRPAAAWRGREGAWVERQFRQPERQVWRRQNRPATS